MKDKIYKIVAEHTKGVRESKTLYDLALITEKTNNELNALFALRIVSQQRELCCPYPECKSKNIKK